jgi:polyferredoxin
MECIGCAQCIDACDNVMDRLGRKRGLIRYTSQDELAGYQEIPIEKVRPWPQGTGPGLRDWLATRGFHPTMADFGTPQDE